MKSAMKLVGKNLLLCSSLLISVVAFAKTPAPSPLPKVIVEIGNESGDPITLSGGIEDVIPPVGKSGNRQVKTTPAIYLPLIIQANKTPSPHKSILKLESCVTTKGIHSVRFTLETKGVISAQQPCLDLRYDGTLHSAGIDIRKNGGVYLNISH